MDLKKYLKLIPVTNSLKPAVVLAMSGPLKITVFMADGKTVTVTSGFKLSPTALKLGDVIWVNPVNNMYQLAQIPQAQVSFVSLDPKTGGITSLVGGFSYRLSNFNRVTDGYRQPGSSFKPFLYAAALNKGYTLASLFNDAPLVFSDPSADDGEWRPNNAEKEFGGPTRLREALVHSLNLVSIRVLQSVGIGYATQFISQFGFSTSQLPQNLTMALGTASVTALQMANAYAVIANGGYRVNPYLIQKVVDGKGKTIFEYQQPAQPPVQVLNPDVDFLITKAMQGVIQSGTGSAARVLNRSDLAGKTGTTNQTTNAWFDGFNSNVVAVAWVGFDQMKPLHEYGAGAALPIWISFMKNALQNMPESTLAQPSDIVSVKIDPVSGLLARLNQTDGVFEYFIQNTVPQQTAPDNTGPAGTGTSSDNGEPIF